MAKKSQMSLSAKFWTNFGAKILFEINQKFWRPLPCVNRSGDSTCFQDVAGLVAESLAPRRMDRPFFPPRCSMKETDDRRRKFRSSKFSVQVQFQVLIDSKAWQLYFFERIRFFSLCSGTFMMIRTSTSQKKEMLSCAIDFSGRRIRQSFVEM